MQVRRRLLAATALVVTALASLAVAGPPTAAQEIPTPGAWHPAPGAVPDLPTYVHMDSQAGDFVGRGLRRTYTRTDTDIKVAAVGGRIDISVYGEEYWNGTFHPPDARQQVQPGLVARIGERDGTGDLRWNGEGRGCNERRGWYAIDEVAYEGTALSELHLRFEQWCDTSPGALHGEIHWSASDPNPGAPTPTRPIPQTMYRPGPDVVPATGSYLYLNGQQGAHVGDGQAYLYGADAMRSGFSWFENGLTRIDSRLRHGDDRWDLRMDASNRADALLPGYYRRLQRWSSGNLVRGEFSATGNGRGCNVSYSDVAIDEIDVRSGRVSDIHLRFSQRCDDGLWAFRGELRWQEADAIRGVLDPPTGVTAAQTGTTATVQWPAVPGIDGAPVTGYVVTTYREGLAVGTTVVEGTATTATVTGLQPHAAHTFKVATTTVHGTGERSRASAAPVVDLPVVTGVAPSGGPRTGGTVVAITGTGLADATDVHFGTEAARGFTVVSPTRIEAVTPDLLLGGHAITVTDGDGRSEPGATFTARPLAAGAPGPVSATPAWGRATATWSAPADDGDLPRTGYVVRALPEAGGDPVLVQVGASATTATVTGLAPGASYRLRVTALSAAGEGAAATSAPVVLPAPVLGPFATAEALVAQQHLDLLGRPATDAEVATGAAALLAGTQSSGQLVAALTDRPEWGGRRGPVVRLYSAYFLRRPDADGLEYWAAERAGGTSLARVSQSFAASPEFRTRYGQLGNAEFVRRVYLNVLGRQPDADGLAYWTDRLATGTARGTLMIGFSESPENVARTRAATDVVLVHHGLLRRMPTATELTAGLAVVTGPGGVAAYAEQLLVSPAYAARF